MLQHLSEVKLNTVKNLSQNKHIATQKCYGVISVNIVDKYIKEKIF